jgi:DNA modification methylase
VRRGKNAQWCGDRTQSTLWQVPNLNPFGGGGSEDAVSGHGTQKPVELMRRAILNHTAAGDSVFDPFLGSGTTLVAAERTRRRCYGMDIDARYVDMAVRRWQELTGQQAVLEADGKSFDAVCEQRTASTPRNAMGRAPQVDSREVA